MADVPLGVPLATVDLAAIEARVEGLAAVGVGEASRAWPDQVRIDVTEREAVAVVSWEGQWRGLDEDRRAVPHATPSSRRASPW